MTKEKLQPITVSLEWAKELRKAGWPQHGQFFYWWHLRETGHFDEKKQWKIVTKDDFAVTLDNERYAAPTASEIIRKIPCERRSEVQLERLDDPNEWAALYCACNQA